MYSTVPLVHLIDEQNDMKYEDYSNKMDSVTIFTLVVGNCRHELTVLYCCNRLACLLQASTRIQYGTIRSHLLSSPFYSLSLLVVTQIRGHIAGSFPLLITVRALHFYRENISAPSSLVDLRRHLGRSVLTHARRSHQLLILFYLCK